MLRSERPPVGRSAVEAGAGAMNPVRARPNLPHQAAAAPAAVSTFSLFVVVVSLPARCRCCLYSTTGVRCLGSKSNAAPSSRSLQVHGTRTDARPAVSGQKSERDVVTHCMPPSLGIESTPCSGERNRGAPHMPRT